MPFWHRAIVFGVVLVLTLLVARVIDRRIGRRGLTPEIETRYRVIRRTVTTVIVAVGVLSALLVIPQVRAIAGGVLASTAVAGLVVGFAAQSTLSNFVAGLLIAFSQPIRLGDRVELQGGSGTVEEIGLTYTFIRTAENVRLVIPNAKLASDTIRNATIVSREKRAQVTVQVPLATDLVEVVELVRAEAPGDAEVLVTGLDGSATLAVRAWADDPTAAELLESDLRLRLHARLRAAGVLA